MRIAVLAAFTLAALLAAAPLVQAQEAPSSIAPTGHETKEVDAPKLPATGPMLCVHTDPPTGSRLGARTSCHTETEWRMIHDNSMQTLMEMQDRDGYQAEKDLLKNAR
jgi:hypothetical protein